MSKRRREGKGKKERKGKRTMAAVHEVCNYEPAPVAASVSQSPPDPMVKKT